MSDHTDTDACTDTTTATDYLWLEERHPDLMEAYCVTLVRGLGPGELLRAIGAEPGARRTGVTELAELSHGAYRDDSMLVGVTAIDDDWTLMVEENGYLGVTDDTMLTASRGRTVVSHFRNVNAVDRFCWYEDGSVRLYFEPLFAHEREGTHPDELLTEMRESGFDIRDAEGDNLAEPDVEPDDEPDVEQHVELVTEAAFALAHRITGVRLTPKHFASAEFLTGVAPRP